jgi:hypothetical protein
MPAASFLLHKILFSTSSSFLVRGVKLKIFKIQTKGQTLWSSDTNPFSLRYWHIKKRLLFLIPFRTKKRQNSVHLNVVGLISSPSFFSSPSARLNKVYFISNNIGAVYYRLPIPVYRR